MALALAPPYLAVAHDVPKDATVQAFVKPAGRQLDLLVRVPLKSIRDVDFPEQERGYVDLVKLARSRRAMESRWGRPGHPAPG